MIGSGTISSGATVSGSVVSDDVRIGTGSRVEGSVILPGVRIGRNCVVRHSILDKNVVVGPGGALGLIDPAAHFGWAEADLAMTALFGGFPENFYAAYAATRPLEAGWRERFSIYNLYHLLNHLNLFGAGYLSDVRDILQRYR